MNQKVTPIFKVGLSFKVGWSIFFLLQTVIAILV